MNECLTFPFSNVELSAFGELFEGRLFHHRGGPVPLLDMVDVLCPPSHDKETFCLRLRSALDDVSSSGGLKVLTIEQGGDACQVRLLFYGVSLLATCTIMSGGRNSAAPTKKVFDYLSKRELEVLELLVSGMANKQVAAALYLSPRTVEKHRANIHKKTGTRSLAVLTQRWVESSHARPTPTAEFSHSK